MSGPDWAREFLATPKPPVSAPRQAAGPAMPTNGHGASTAYGRAAIQGEIEKLLGTPEGGRNEQLNKSGFKLGQLVPGEVSEADVVAELTNAATLIGLSTSEIRGTVRSGVTSGQGHPREPEPLYTLSETTPEAITGSSEEASDEPRERTSWWPRPIGERASEAAEAPLPTHLERDDGNCLFYSAKVNGVIGESESGKTWVALLAVSQAVIKGERVLFLDFEDSPASVYRRLEALQLTTTQLALVDYADPSESLALEQYADLREALQNDYGVIVADGVNAAMTLMDYELNSNTDATKFSSRLLRPLARTGACVITVDHVPKNPDTRGKGGIGAQAKRAMTDGCLLTAEVVEAFGYGQSGSVKLSVDKDKNGRVRGISTAGDRAGIMQVVSISDVVQLSIETPTSVATETDASPEWRPTRAMEQVSKRLEVAGKSLSFRAIEQGVEARAATIRAAIKALFLDGYIAIEDGPRGANMHSLTRPYVENDPDRSTVSQPRPTVVPDTVKTTVSTVSPLPPSVRGAGTVTQSVTAEDGEAVRPEDTLKAPTKAPGVETPDLSQPCPVCGGPLVGDGTDACADNHYEA